MTAEPSAADVKRALPYSPPHYAGGSATSAAAKTRTSTPASHTQESRSRTAHRHHGRDREDDRDSDGGADDDDDEPDDDDDSATSAGGAKAVKKPQGKADEESSAATASGKVGEGDDDDEKKANATKKSRRELPPHTVAILKGWMLSPEHVKHPYPTDEDKQMLLKKTGINMKQLTNWFTNARKRIWKPMMRREHSRQLQSAIEYEKTQPRDGFAAVAGAPHPQVYRDGEFPGAARGVVRHSFDAGSLGGPHPQVPVDPYGRAGPAYPPPPHAPIPVGYAPRAGRSHSEALPGTEMDSYMDAMRIRKRVHAPDDVTADTFGPSDKRYRRSTAMSPRSLKILQDWVATHSHLEYPFPTDPEKLQLSRDTGLDVQQIELWFKSNRERIGAANYAIQNGAPGLSPSRRSLPGRSIPSRDNPMFPPSVYGDRREAVGHRSIPANGNPMFPPRPTAPPVQRSSIPGNGNPQFPPPPSGRRDAPDGYYPNNLPPTPYSSGQYATHGYSSTDAARHARSMSINVGQFMRPQPRPVASSGASMPVPTGAPGAASGLPSLSARNVPPRASGGPTMGQPRDGRSHTLDMGLFTDARRRKMNFQDILASTSAAASGAPQHLPTPTTVAARPLSAAGIAETSSLANAESHGYAHAGPTYGAKSFERPHLGTSESGSCARCGARAGACGCGVSEDAQLRRIV